MRKIDPAKPDTPLLCENAAGSNDVIRVLRDSGNYCLTATRYFCYGVTEEGFPWRIIPGYRIYFGVLHNSIVILLGGGTKRGQQRDIARAQTHWNEFLERIKESQQ